MRALGRLRRLVGRYHHTVFGAIHEADHKRDGALPRLLELVEQWTLARGADLVLSIRPCGEPMPASTDLDRLLTALSAELESRSPVPANPARTAFLADVPVPFRLLPGLIAWTDARHGRRVDWFPEPDIIFRLRASA